MRASPDHLLLSDHPRGSHSRGHDQPWQGVSLCISGFGGQHAPLKRILLDWFDFLGGRPGEVVYVDGGSAKPSRDALCRLLHEGFIDRLELLHPDHWENHPHRCYIQEHQSGRLATLDYLCFVKLDTLSYRSGRDQWLKDAFALLEDPTVFAITNSHLVDPMVPSTDHTGLLRGDFASLNFALMKRSAFESSMQSHLQDSMTKRFKNELPTDLDADKGYERALIEWAWRAHCRRFGRCTLAWPESSEWMIFHMNKSGRKLLKYRSAMRRFDGVEQYFDLPKALYRPPITGLKATGRLLENLVRKLKSKRV